MSATFLLLETTQGTTECCLPLLYNPRWNSFKKHV